MIQISKIRKGYDEIRVSIPVNSLPLKPSSSGSSENLGSNVFRHISISTASTLGLLGSKMFKNKKEQEKWEKIAVLQIA